MKNKPLFRVWDSKEKMYVPNEYVLVNPYGEMFNGSVENCMFSPSNWIIEKYIFTDDTGGDIFVGDIINDGVQNQAVGLDYYKDISYGHGDCGYIIGLSCVSGYGKGDKIKIIGNIHYSLNKSK